MEIEAPNLEMEYKCTRAQSQPPTHVDPEFHL